MSPHGKKYVPHLPSLLAMGEHNYGKLMLLLPDVDDRDMTYEFTINTVLTYQITILDVARYTTTVEIAQVAKNLPKFLKPALTVRMYHDVRSAEVLSVQNIGKIQPSYDYPNLQMHQKNEKFMTNVFLTEWLTFCERQQK
jgi:uncharacterized protein YqiB (DUF1249 family)